MTREGAIQHLEWLSDIDFTKEYPKYPIVTKREQVEALQMAIEALEAQDVTDTNVGDIVYRQAAIDIAFDIFPDDEYFREQFVKSIEALPSVQPEDCGTCKHGYFGDEQCNSCRVRFTSHYERRNDDDRNG